MEGYLVRRVTHGFPGSKMFFFQVLEMAQR